MVKSTPSLEDQQFATRITQIRVALVGDERGAQAKMAENLGIPRATWNNYERGRARPKPEVRESLYSRFRVSLEYLDLGVGPLFRPKAECAEAETTREKNSA